MTEEFRTNDRQLTAGDIGVLENAGQVVHFFARLGYDKKVALRTFIQRLYPRAPETFFGAGGVVERLQDEGIIALRNQAAHDQTLGRQDARVARQWALGILQYL